MVKSTKSGQKPTKNRLLSHFSIQTSGSTKKVEKTALKSVLSIVNYIDLQSPKTADKIDKMIKESYKKYPKGTEQRSLREELSLTGMPPDMIDKLGLKTKEDYPVYRVPEEIYPSQLARMSVENDVKAQTFVPAGEMREFLNIGEDIIQTPFSITKKYSPFTIVHEATHLSDLEKKPTIQKIKSILDYSLNDLELSAFFNEIVYYLYSKNKATYPEFVNFMYGNKKLKDIKEHFSPNIFLWGFIKDSFKKNGLQKTIDMKKEIIEKTKDKIIDSLIPYIADVYVKSAKKSDENFNLIFDLLEQVLLESSLSKETIDKIAEKFYNFISSPSRDWLDKLTQDEIYNFYGDRFSKDF